MFVAEIVAVNVDEKCLDENNRLALEKTGLIAYSHNNYYTLGRNVGFFGFSVCRSAVKAKEKMKNVVVELKEPKIVKSEDKSSSEFKTRRKPWGVRKTAFETQAKKPAPFARRKKSSAPSFARKDNAADKAPRGKFLKRKATQKLHKGQ